MHSAERGGRGHQGGTPSPLNPGACQVGTGGKLGCQDTQGFPLHSPSLWDFSQSSCFCHAAPKGSYFSFAFLDTVDTRLFSGVFPLKTNKQNKERQDNLADNMQLLVFGLGLLEKALRCSLCDSQVWEARFNPYPPRAPSRTISFLEIHIPAS